ncbi:hypothetical protein FA13DRAFT_1790640 [Coprinellus micaceus]|uniref:Uncharacterized protein n=1 Tax=Coprinellus micaceus TaxID=71717 RepID=A0A4Y7TEC3_COPMI|nr:hypothetical protein FA13DRAFT_1790640 [Coprinellus micaceus]
MPTQQWPVFDVLFLFSDVPHAQRPPQSAGALRIETPSTQRAIVKVANRATANEQQYHAAAARLCVLATRAPQVVRPFNSMPFQVELLSRIEVSYIWLQTFQLDVAARLPLAPFAVVFDARCEPPFQPSAFAFAIQNFMDQNDALPPCEHFRLVSLAYRFYASGVHGVLVFGQRMASAYWKTRRACIRGDPGTDMFEDEAVTKYPGHSSRQPWHFYDRIIAETRTLVTCT